MLDHVSRLCASFPLWHNISLALEDSSAHVFRRLHNLVTGRQQDKQTVITLEKKVSEERKLRQVAESQLQQEKKKVNIVYTKGDIPVFR